ncbi:DUF4157 domain-containing protein [Rheinheimera sp. 1928-s]|uniref:eCIS core domain-containing protein n=1 Tax=Rheinheimera sp. 1928-s TaxID=3033803 RepID=UPI002633FF65|nr:DUF4157 domain-containing protein [Rheinheimera sp. 1928-s]MDF3126600.1 DUF4157 domain-containing protein [Rheinheimera sp. 1928-s]
MAEFKVEHKKQQSSEHDTVSQRKGETVLPDNRGQVSQTRVLTDNRTAQLAPDPKPKPNNTGLPNQLKTGIESLSGMSMDHVKVHYNSSQPAQLNAHAYAQGSNIHLAPGQEKHLPHEAWHVVQQAQGRVKPTMQMKSGTSVNDDKGLEQEADVMGGKAMNYEFSRIDHSLPVTSTAVHQNHPIQRVKLPISTQSKALMSQKMVDNLTFIEREFDHLPHRVALFIMQAVSAVQASPQSILTHVLSMDRSTITNVLHGLCVLPPQQLTINYPLVFQEAAKLGQSIKPAAHMRALEAPKIEGLFGSKGVDEKGKTGDSEHLDMLTAAYQSMTTTQGLTSGNAKYGRKSYTRELLHQVGNLEEDPLTLVSAMNEVLNRPKNIKGFESKVPPLLQNRKMFAEMTKQLGPQGNQFLINLALYNFRTAEGGRVRKSTHLLRGGSDEYARPFESSLPYYVTYLMHDMAPHAKKAPHKRATPSKLMPKVDRGYAPTTRFTASFPLKMEHTQGNPAVLHSPRIPESLRPQRDRQTKYRFLPSFGFAEPAYTTWDANDRTETAGTRLSLGAYSLNADYLTELKRLLARMNATDAQNYQKYGGVSAGHVQFLLSRFKAKNYSQWNDGAALAIQWSYQLLGAAYRLVAKTKSEEVLNNPSSKHLFHLQGFFDYILGKIHQRANKLAFIKQSQGKSKSLSQRDLFDHIWVIESSLWEFAFLGSTCLSLAEMTEVLEKQFPSWKASMDTSPKEGDEHPLQESVQVGKHNQVSRSYFPSGTAAADNLHKILLQAGYSTYPFRADKKALSTFTPYFEFYQNSTSFLSPESVKDEQLTGKRKGGQLWINLSDSLHTDLLNSADLKESGLKIARQILAFVKHTREKFNDLDAPIALVIDYTKFSGDMPNNRLYPILMQIQNWLSKALGSQLHAILFLRSNLKFNTGLLDRYQSGEILAHQSNALHLDKPLKTGAKESFKQGGAEQKIWNLHGEYIPMMKKTYLLSDAIATGRWDEYTTLLGKQSESSEIVSIPHSEDLAGLKKQVGAMQDLSHLQQGLLTWIESPGKALFFNLTQDIRRKSIKPYVGASTRTAIHALWEKLKQYDKKFSPKAAVMHEKLREDVCQAYSDTLKSMGTIVGGVGQGKNSIPKHERNKKQLLGSYASRLRAAEEKLRAFQGVYHDARGGNDG